MMLSDEQIRQISAAILPSDIRKYCIDNYKDFNKFQIEENDKEINRKEALKYDNRRTKKQKAMDNLV